MTEAVLDIIEVVFIIVGTAEEEPGLSGEKFLGEVVVSKDTLATADEFLHILLIHDGVVLVNQLAEVPEVGEDEVHLAEVGIVLLVSHLNLVLQFILQLRQAKNLLRVGMDFPVVVLGDKGAKFLYESEISLVVDAAPVGIGLKLLPRLLQWNKQFVNLGFKSLPCISINLVGKCVKVLSVSGVAFKFACDPVEVNV